MPLQKHGMDETHRKEVTFTTSELLCGEKKNEMPLKVFHKHLAELAKLYSWLPPSGLS